MNKKIIFEEIVRLQSEADQNLRIYWANETVFTLKWWLLVALSMLPPIIWWKLVDRKRLFEIMTYGLLVAVISGLFDAIGVEGDLWEYKYQIIPLLDVFLVYDISVMPITYMLMYQYFKSWKSFIIAHLVLAFVFAFVAEPFLVWLDVYQMYNWKHIYSFPIYFLMAIVLKWVMIILNNKLKETA